MKRNQYVQALKSLLPVPLYFAISTLLSEYLKKFDIVGPVNSKGQPIFYPYYSSIIFYGLLTLIALGFVYSLLQVKKIDGWLKYALLILIVLLLPIQYFGIIAALVSIFGK